jgi:hypothetical protein
LEVPSKAKFYSSTMNCIHHLWLFSRVIHLLFPKVLKIVINSSIVVMHAKYKSLEGAPFTSQKDLLI